MAAPRLHPGAQLLVLLVIALACGALAQTFSPRRIPWRENWSTRIHTKAFEAGLAIAETADVRAMIESGSVLLFDARSIKDYETGHLPGALPFPDAQRAEFYPQYADILSPEQRVVIYCSGRTCDESLQLCLFLLRHGHTNLALYVGGIQAWQQEGGELVR
jgi:rhodanese-related sulfurtransferase